MPSRTAVRKRAASFTKRSGFSKKNPALDILVIEMDIDQRLEKLTERHEALAESMELVVHLQRKNEEAHQRNEVLLEKSQVLIVQVIESVNSLARIAHMHESRLSNLEGGAR